MSYARRGYRALQERAERLGFSVRYRPLPDDYLLDCPSGGTVRLDRMEQVSRWLDDHEERVAG